MRKFNWMMAALMAFALSFAACEKDKPGTDDPSKPQPPTPTELTFEISVADVTRTSAFINVTPSDLEADYLAVVYNAYSVEQYATDAELIAKMTVSA